MRGEFFLKGLLLSVGLTLLSWISFSQNVLLLMNEENGELVVLRKKQISDILTLGHEYLGDAVGISNQDFILTQRKKVRIDSVHSLVVKNKNLGKVLGLPFKIAGTGLALIGGLLIIDSKEESIDTFGNQENDTNLGQLLGGGAIVGLGVGVFYLGNKAGDRKIENEKTTYYLHQWKVKITDIKNVKRYREALKD